MSATKIPDFFIVGAAKAGATSLYTYLANSPSIFMAPLKEPHFFSPSALHSSGSHEKVSNWDDYVALFFKAADEDVTGEASPSYLWDEASPGLIKSKRPNARTIISLRDPVDRAFSHYLADVRLGWQKLPFYDALVADRKNLSKEWGKAHLYLELGHYAEQVSRYYHHFANDQIKIVWFDDLASNPAMCLEEISSFLSITCPAKPVNSNKKNAAAVPRGRLASSLISDSFIKRAAKAVLPSKLGRSLCDGILLTRNTPTIDDKARIFLEDYYRSEMWRLENLLGCHLPWQWANNQEASGR